MSLGREFTFHYMSMEPEQEQAANEPHYSENAPGTEEAPLKVPHWARHGKTTDRND